MLAGVRVLPDNFDAGDVGVEGIHNALLLLDTREPVCSVGVVGTDMTRISIVEGFGRRVTRKRGGCGERIALALACWVTVGDAGI